MSLEELLAENAALKARIEELNLGNQPFNAVAAQCFAYRTEIRELKAQISQLESIQATHDSEVAMTAYHTAELERAAIVAWLRAEMKDQGCINPSIGLHWLVQQLAQGAHHANRGEGGSSE